ncbi:uncharacterized protein JN550_012092 [Neoarthrinium moseri]|uniref:uncharacterized protein n=1 Tax=Neoarthrinium moseri TaxID=1658444 RepID=UPI001FDD7FB6|nr:uncharacterized protein JN550_012092 [Neoarthrinium moseri]KAI1859283.1 hypothetical protein JN550_012092 [Neoarthrinium moseri]
MGRPKSAEHVGAAVPKDAPPPYTEATGQSSAATPQQGPPAHQPSAQHPGPQGPAQAQVARQFPPAFSVYRDSAWGRTYMLGEHQATPLYAITLHTGWSGQPDVVLHGSSSENAPPLAGVETTAFSRAATVSLPPLPGSGRSVAEEPMAFSGFGNGTHSFTIEVGNTGTTGRRESFEWRHSHGAEVDQLGGRGSGWKLVRLASDAPEGVGGGSHFVGGGPQSSDGKEVVAVWANARTSLSKILNFRFFGSGVTGVMGERWAIMAVITALRIWDKERKSRQNSSA